MITLSVSISHTKYFRSDNGILKSTEFRLELQDNNQDIIFYGVGTHRQNGVVERFIRTMVEKARTVLLNAHARWPEQIDMELWTFAFRHVVTKWNNTPRKDLGYRTPDEAFNGLENRMKDVTHHFADFYPFGIPVYVLNRGLQGNQKILKCEPRAKVDVYLGQSK